MSLGMRKLLKNKTKNALQNVRLLTFSVREKVDCVTLYNETKPFTTAKRIYGRTDENSTFSYFYPNMGSKLQWA